MADRGIQEILSSGEIANVFIGGTASGDKVPKSSEVDTKISTAITLPTDNKKFNDVSSNKPTYVKGQVYYADGVLNVQGDMSDVTLQVGREAQIEVLNVTGNTISNGKAVTFTGVANGVPLISLAIATSFQSARVAGMATHDILDGEIGIIASAGSVGGIDTSALDLNAPIYLSDTVAGALTNVAPDVATQVGGVLIQDATNGTFFVKIRDTINLPTILGILKGQNVPEYTLAANVPKTIANYVSAQNVFIPVNALTGSIDVSFAGWYNANFSFNGTLSDEEIDMTFELFDTTNTVVLETFKFTSGRGSNPNLVPMSKSLVIPTEILADNTIVVMRVTSATNETLIFDQASFSMTSLHVR